MNRLGKFLKTLRIQRGELLFDMAGKLGVSSAFLSAVENDKRSAPTAWVDAITSEYDLAPEQVTELEEAVGESVRQIRLDISDSDPRKKTFAMAFARNFDELNDEEIRRIMEILRKRRT